MTFDRDRFFGSFRFALCEGCSTFSALSDASVTLGAKVASFARKVSSTRSASATFNWLYSRLQSPQARPGADPREAPKAPKAARGDPGAASLGPLFKVAGVRSRISPLCQDYSATISGRANGHIHVNWQTP